jgi:hypothetical protein
MVTADVQRSSDFNQPANSRAVNGSRASMVSVRIVPVPRRTCDRSKRCASAARQRVRQVQRQAGPAQVGQRRPFEQRIGAGPDALGLRDIEHEPVGQVSQTVERFDRAAAPPHQRGQARQPQRRDRVVQICGREPRDRNRVLGDARHRRGVLPFGNQDGAHAARFAELLERVGGGDEPVGLADDDHGRGQRAGRTALAFAPVAHDARERDFDLRERDVVAAREQRVGNLAGARTHSVLQRRPSAFIISSASRGPHSPAS